MSTFAIPNEKNGSPNAEIAQLVEHNLAKVGVASSSLVFRSKTKEVSRNADLLFEKYHPTGYHYMSVVLVHKVGFFVCQCRLFCFYASLAKRSALCIDNTQYVPGILLHGTLSISRYRVTLIPKTSLWRTAGACFFITNSQSGSYKICCVYPILPNMGQAHPGHQLLDHQ